MGVYQTSALFSIFFFRGSNGRTRRLILCLLGQDLRAKVKHWHHAAVGDVPHIRTMFAGSLPVDKKSIRGRALSWETAPSMGISSLMGRGDCFISQTLSRPSGKSTPYACYSRRFFPTGNSKAYHPARLMNLTICLPARHGGSASIQPTPSFWLWNVLIPYYCYHCEQQLFPSS